MQKNNYPFTLVNGDYVTRENGKNSWKMKKKKKKKKKIRGMPNLIWVEDW